jgi:glycosyltransferase involved in cell wall biosynthesis
MTRANVPAVSVFVASYNGAPHVDAAVRSILDQTWRDLECIVVDDGSRAETLDILRRLAASDPRMRLVESAHQGQIATLNAALALCRAPLIARLDHDDISVPDRIAKQVAYLTAHPDVVACGCALGMMDGNGRDLPPPRANPFQRLRFDPLAFPPKQIFLAGTTLMARAAALHAIGGFRAAFRAAEDRDLGWRLSAHGRLVRMPDVLIRYRIHATNLSHLGRRTQLYSQFLSNLSAAAQALGRDDSAIVNAIDVDGDYQPAIAQYRALLGGAYPVETYWLYFLARMRVWEVGGYASGADLKRAILAHLKQRPFDPARIKTAITALRYTRRKPAITVDQVKPRG